MHDFFIAAMFTAILLMPCLTAIRTNDAEEETL